ncbi:hypothetical protein [Novosphingobium sp. P6W]|uniref:hypothetical protein n=1 Tax=Novosphingobium sp. P6W TaxID=1609758 RepID=UPI0005C2CA20|nr:hypothetical protein [Novosphingobium sp. P6W]AXB75470.1 hypothetical protein TQ38_002200 [Novosphingobium sp. P6W]KIS32504.1 hypothetical protein TQ38_09210 [Novosphingobium sp. P6W]
MAKLSTEPNVARLFDLDGRKVDAVLKRARISVDTIAEREQIPIASRTNYLQVYVGDQKRTFVWVFAGSTRPDNGAVMAVTNWVGLYTQEESKNLGIGFTGSLPSGNVAGLAEGYAATDALAAIKIADFRATALSSGTNPAVELSWALSGTPPTSQMVSWGGSSIALPGTARNFTPPANYSAITGFGIVGNSLSDSGDVNTRYSQVLAARLGVSLISVARYSSDWREVYRLGAKPIYVTVAGNSLAAGGTAKAVTLINGLAPSNDPGLNPASFLNTGDANIVTNLTMSGTIVDGSVTRHVTVSIPNGASLAYTVTQDAGLAALALTGPVLFIPDISAQFAGRTVVVAVGQNFFFSGVPNSYGDYTNPQMWVDMALIVQFLQAMGCRVIILPVLPQADWTARGVGTPYNAHLAANARTASLYPDLYARTAGGQDWIAYLKAGAQSSADNDDVAAGYIPRLFRIQTGSDTWDFTHLNEAGDARTADFLQLALAAQKIPPAITQSTVFTLSASGINPRTGEALPFSSTTAAVRAGALTGIATALQPGSPAAQVSYGDRSVASAIGDIEVMGTAFGKKLANLDVNALSTLITDNPAVANLMFAITDAAGYFGAGLAPDGTLIARQLQSLAAMVTPLLKVAVGGEVQLGNAAKIALGDRGSIVGGDGAMLDMRGMNYEFCICDQNDNVLLGWLNGKLYGLRAVTQFTTFRITITFANGVILDIGDHNYDFAISDANGNVFLGWKDGIGYTSSGAAGSVDLDKRDAANKAYSQRVYARRVRNIQLPTAAYNALYIYGQSLGQGDETWPALSRTARLGNLMLGGNTMSSADAGTFVQFTPTGLQPLVAQTVNGSTRYDAAGEAALAPGNGSRGEPSNIGWANGAKARFNDYLVVSNATDRNFVTINVSKSGATIGELEKTPSEGGTVYYNKYTGSLTQLITAVGASTVTVAGISYMQGEHDYFQASGHASLNITYAAYKGKLTTMAANMQADAMAATGQTKPPAFMIYQTGGSYTRDVDSNGVPGLHVGMAQLDFSLASDTAWMVGPAYPYTDKGGHFDSNGSRWFGHQIAKVWSQVVIEGRDWEPLRPIKVWQEGTSTIYVAYHVPCGPLVFDEPQLSGGAEYNGVNKGFRLTDDVGAIGISEVAIVRDTIIRITTSRAAGANPKVWYASQGQTSPGNGMVRDSDPSLASDNYVYEPDRGMYPTANIAQFVNKPYPLWNWGVAFVLPVGYSEGN